MAPELDVAHGFAVAFENAIRIRQRGPAWEAEIHVVRAGRYVAKHVLHLSAESEPDGDRIHLIDRFRSVRRLFENNLAQRQRDFRDVPVIGLEESEQLRVGRTSLGRFWHVKNEYTLSWIDGGGANRQAVKAFENRSHVTRLVILPVTQSGVARLKTALSTARN
jgi:hypothetical protein